MTKRKTASAYAEEIDVLHRELQASPDSDTIRKKIDYRVKKWMTLIDIRIEIANNEQRPWDAEMLGYPTAPMRTKKNTDYNQVGDYIGVVNMPDGPKYIGVVVERKSVEDLYGTLINEDNRARFHREIDRFKDDERFNQMIVMVEGSLSEFLLYQPSFSGNDFDYTRRFDTKRNNVINDKKLTVLADLFIMGVPVMFADNSTLASQMCGRLFRESIKKGYWKLLNLDEPKRL